MSSFSRHRKERVTTAAVKRQPLHHSASAGSLSDSVRDCTDDTAGITRSSLTLHSVQLDSSSRTWPSSLSASLHGASPPPGPPTIPSSSGVRTAAGLDEADGMDAFDLVLAQEPAQPHHRTAVAALESTKTPPATTGMNAEVAVTSPSAVDVPGAVRLDRVPVKTRHPLRHADGVLPSPLTFSTHEEKVQHVRALLHETRVLHDALWQQLCELQQAEERTQRRGSRKAAEQRHL